MLGDIKKELARLIASEIYDSAKQAGKNVTNSLKDARLAKSGKGLPDAILAAFDDSFLTALDYMVADGSATWRTKAGEDVTFDFQFSGPLIDKIKKTKWAAAAKLTSDGTNQVNALGGDKPFQAVIEAAIAPVFDYAIRKIRGEYRDHKGWIILTEVMDVKVAKRNTTNFQPRRLFWWVRHKDKSSAKKKYKLAQSLIVSGLFHSASKPSKGPYY